MVGQKWRLKICAWENIHTFLIKDAAFTKVVLQLMRADWSKCNWIIKQYMYDSFSNVIIIQQGYQTLKYIIDH